MSVENLDYPHRHMPELFAAKELPENWDDEIRTTEENVVYSDLPLISAKIIQTCGASITERETCDWIPRRWSVEHDYSGDIVQPFDLTPGVSSATSGKRTSSLR